MKSDDSESRKKNSHCLQFCDLLGNRGDVCYEGRGVFDVEVDQFIVEIVWVQHIVCGERQLQ